jgi:hypothetical protein
VIDLASVAVTAVPHPSGVSLSFIDGLYAWQRKLIAIQNGPMLPRIVEFKLDDTRRRIVAMKILERRNPAFDGITTGVLIGKRFHYIANPQTDKPPEAALAPLRLFSVRIRP